MVAFQMQAVLQKQQKSCASNTFMCLLLHVQAHSRPTSSSSRMQRRHPRLPSSFLQQHNSKRLHHSSSSSSDGRMPHSTTHQQQRWPPHSLKPYPLGLIS
jgi:hypothetical protein